MKRPKVNKLRVIQGYSFTISKDNKRSIVSQLMLDATLNDSQKSAKEWVDNVSWAKHKDIKHFKLTVVIEEV
jgi:hypothetical protein